MSLSADTEIYQNADIYHDFYYGRGKDYGEEAAHVVKEIRARRPGASSLLDTACGSGGHLREFRRSFEDTAGLDLAPEMLDVAARELPSVPLHQGDVRDFRLARRFEVVTCMFSSIGYLPTVVDLRRAIANLADHLVPGGVLAIEPWWFPDTFRSGWVAADLVEVNGRTISRVSHSIRQGEKSRMEVHYTVATPATGVAHFTDTHVMSLFDKLTYADAFRAAGIDPDYVRPDPSSPGLFVGTVPQDGA